MSDLAYQTMSMTAMEMKRCQELIRAMSIHKFAEPFLTAVDLSAAPNYLKIIKRPIDLSMIDQKLHCGHYADVRDLLDDIDLMLDNCQLYNGPGSELFDFAKGLRAFVDTRREIVIGFGMDAVDKKRTPATFIPDYESDVVQKWLKKYGKQKDVKVRKRTSSSVGGSPFGSPQTLPKPAPNGAQAKF
ncbi:cat eye syndrome chromosome region, candidate 2, partial [Irineochytrium annulatum]